MDEEKFKALCDSKKLLVKAKESLTERSWIKGELFRDADEQSGAFCALGAVVNAGASRGVGMYRTAWMHALDDAAKRVYAKLVGKPVPHNYTLTNAYTAVPLLNDNYKTILPDVHQMFDLAIQDLDQQMEALCAEEEKADPPDPAESKD